MPERRKNERKRKKDVNSGHCDLRAPLKGSTRTSFRQIVTLVEERGIGQMEGGPMSATPDESILGRGNWAKPTPMVEHLALKFLLI